jgi:TolA-binding protein
LFSQNSVVGYEQWAHGARAQVEALRAVCRVDQMRALSSGTRAAVASLQDRLVLLEEENHALRDSVATQLQTQAETNRILTTIANQLQSLTTNNERRRQAPPQEEAAAAETAPGAAVVEEPPAAAAAEAAPAGRLAPARPALRRPPPPPVAHRQEPNDQDQAVGPLSHELSETMNLGDLIFCFDLWGSMSWVVLKLISTWCVEATVCIPR